MNRFLLIVLLIVIFKGSLIAQDVVTIYEVCQVVDDAWYEGERQLIQFYEKSDEINIGVDITNNQKIIVFNSQQKNQLLLILNKIEKWDSIAQNLNAEIEKKVGIFNCSGAFKIGDENKVDKYVDVEFTFIGKTDIDGYRTFAILDIPKMQSSTDTNIECKSNSILVYSKDIKKLIYGITSMIEDYQNKSADRKNETKKYDSYFN